MSTSTPLGDALRAEVSPFVPLAEAQIESLDRHFALLVRWNRTLNLTKITKPEVAAVRHYGESLFLAARLSPGAVVDVGSGAGFPGIPAAVLRSECSFTLLESDQRKAVFLREASRKLSNVRVVCERAERYLGNADWLISRAVSIPELLRLKIAPNVALLVGGHDASSLQGFDVTPLPWDSGVLAIRKA